MSSLPTISVVIPNYNHGVRLKRVLQSLTNQDTHEFNIEIIVVDNGSTDNSVEIANSFEVVVLHVANGLNPYVGRNKGMHHAKGEYIALLDSTCVPEKSSYLSELYSNLNTNNAGLTVGNIQFELGANPTLSEITDALIFIPNKEDEGKRSHYPGGSLFFSRATLDKVGGFREDMRSGADGEWSARVYSVDLGIAYSEKAVVLYSAKSWSVLLKKAVRIGKGHRTLLMESGEYSTINELLSMRPPSPKYLNKVIEERGRPGFRRKWVPLVFAIWLWRIAVGKGRLIN